MDLPHGNGSNLLRELIDVLLRSWIALIQPAFEDMGKLVELAELPPREGRVPSATDG